MLKIIHCNRVTYAMGDITVSAESDTDRTGADTSTVGVTYAMADGMTVSLENSEDVNTSVVTYSSGAISVAVKQTTQLLKLGKLQWLMT
jgi:hypothetical protein